MDQEELEKRFAALKPIVLSLRDWLVDQQGTDLQVFSTVIPENGYYKSKITVKGRARVFAPLKNAIRDYKRWLEAEAGLENTELSFREDTKPRIAYLPAN